jgi:hypothetical protein
MFYQSRFRPSAQDMCGTFWSITDYMVQGCDRAFAGAPPASDPQRLASGSFLKRVPSGQANDGAQYGAALTWNSTDLASQFGLYHARYINRTAVPGARKSSRVGAALIAGDPDGKNVAFFTEYPDAIDLLALTFLHQRRGSALFGELAYRRNQPLMLPPGDVLPALLSPSAPSLLRAEIDALALGGVFHAFDRYRTVQLQAGLQHDFGRVGALLLGGQIDVVGKHVAALPEPALRRYGRADQYGTGPVNGVCQLPGAPPQPKRCSMDGYVTPNAAAYRVRIDARMADVLPQLNAHASLLFVHDVKGWSYDFMINEGRRSMNMALRLDFRRRYVAELVYAPIWGGRYNHHNDRDLLSLAVGITF